MTSLKSEYGFFWALFFHTTTSLFYMCILLTFMSTNSAVFTGRMITTWYLVFHMGFIFLRLMQDLINVTPAKDWKFNEILAKFNNLVFISLIFPFALHIPLVYWLLFHYDSNLMLPNFVEMSLPPWVSTSAHSVIALVALIEMTTTKYTYEGNHVVSLIIMSTFSAGYIACLVGTYVQYGFWLYPIFHLLPRGILPFVFLILMALLLLMYTVGKIIAQRLFGSTETVKVDEIDEKFVNKQGVEKPLLISSSCISSVGNNDTFVDADRHTSSPLVVFKKVLEQTVFLPFQSNYKKNENDEKNAPGKNLQEQRNTEIKNKNGFLNLCDEVESVPSLTETELNKIELTEEGNCAKHTPYDGVTSKKQSISGCNDDNQLKEAELSLGNDKIQILNGRTKQDSESSISSVEYAVINSPREPSNVVDNSNTTHCVDEIDSEMNPNYTKCGESSLIKSVVDESSNNQSIPLNNADSEVVNCEVESISKRAHNGTSSFRFRLELFPKNSPETSPLNERISTKDNIIDKNSTEKKLDSHIQKCSPIRKASNSNNKNNTSESGTDFRNKAQTTHYNLEKKFTKSKDENTIYTPVFYTAPKKQNRRKFINFFKLNVPASEVQIQDHRDELNSRNSSVFEPITKEKNANSDTSSVKRFELQTNDKDYSNITNYCGLKKPNQKKRDQQDLQTFKKHRPSTSQVDFSELLVKCHKMQRTKKEARNGQKMKSEKIENNMCECVCKHNEEGAKKRKNEKHYATTHPGHINDKKCKKKDETESTIQNDYSTFPTHNRKHNHVLKNCEELLKKKTLEKRNEKIKKFAWEKSRYEILPKIKASLNKVNVTSDLRASDMICRCERENSEKNQAEDFVKSLPAPRDSKNQLGGNTKKKTVPSFFKFSGRSQKGEGKELVEILKKCVKGSKIEAIFTTIPVKDEIQSSIDLNRIKKLQNLPASLFSENAQMYKFCILLS